MFRKRRQRDNSPAPAGADAGSVSPLIGQLREIGQASVAPEDALEPALRAIVEASGAGAGALCLFDPRYGVLRLAAESGLSDEGCRRLRNVRRGDPSSWDMPLHGVLNKRAYLIESAAKNRYVPQLVEHFASVRTVVCVPVYAGPVPLATVVLVAMGSRSFTEGDIRALERPLRELGKLVEAVRRRVAPVLEAFPTLLGVPQDYSGVVEERDHLRSEMASRFAEHASLISEVSARSQENDRLRVQIERLTEERAQLQTALEQGRGSTERVEDLSEALAAAERERARLAGALEAAALERGEAVRREGALDSGRAEAQRIARETAAELQAVRKALATAKMDAAAEIDERTAEMERLQEYVAELEASAERERGLARERQREHERLSSELRSATAREQQLRAELQGSAERLESGNVDDLRDALAQARAADESRAAALAEVEIARTALAEQRTAFETLEAENARMRGEFARLEVSDTSRRSDEHRLETALGEEQARAQAAEARLAALERHATTLRESGNRTIADSRERAAELAAVSAHLESIAAERDALMSELAASAAKVTRVEETLMREVGERERLAEALGVAQAALGALEGGRSERAPLAFEPQKLERPVPGGETERPATEPARPRDTMRVLTVAPTSSRARTRENEGKRIAVLDVDPIWESAAISGYEVVLVSPEEDTAGALAELEPARVVVNLAAPGALEAVAALRGTGSESKVWGCIGVAGSDRAIPTGIVEVAARPLDCDAILDILKAYTSRGTRVVTAGADVDTLMSLRQAMARLGMSVSMAWDAKQATDLLTVVRPEVVVIDLDLPRQAGYGIIARLSVANPIPCAVIVPGKDDATEAFAAALAQPSMGDLSVPRDRLLADAIGRQEALAADRRLQKIRAVGRK